MLNTFKKTATSCHFSSLAIVLNLVSCYFVVMLLGCVINNTNTSNINTNTISNSNSNTNSIITIIRIVILVMTKIYYY